jgi:hypothetical protein
MENQKKALHQLDLLNKYDFEKTAVLAGINTFGEVIALKPIVENLGLDWGNVQRVIRKNLKPGQLMLLEQMVESGKCFV